MITALLRRISLCLATLETLGTVSVANIRRITVFFAAMYSTCVITAPLVGVCFPPDVVLDVPRGAMC